jgi:hypothetical protein
MEEVPGALDLTGIGKFGLSATSVGRAVSHSIDNDGFFYVADHALKTIAKFNAK